jgi:hypothetical protein
MPLSPFLEVAGRGGIIFWINFSVTVIADSKYEA